MNLYDETLIRFDDTGKDICINFAPTIFQTAKTMSYMLTTCQWFLLVDFFVSHFFFSIQSLLMARQTIVSSPRVLQSINPLQNRASFFLPVFNTCKVDTYFQKTKMMLYEKM
jgi:hypothetical protein